MLSYSYHNNRLEIYGVKIDQKDLQQLLKNNGLKRYPPKQCRTKYNATIEAIEGIDVYNPEEKKQSGSDNNAIDKCIECENEQNSHNTTVINVIKKLEEENKKLQDIIDGLQKKEITKKQSNTKSKKETTRNSSMTPIAKIKDFLAKDPILPILREYKVENGRLYATDMEKYIVITTSLEDGMYKSIDPVVKGEYKISEYVELPEKNEEDIVSTFTYDKKTIEAIKYHVKTSISQKFIQKKNFSPLFTGRLIGAGTITCTDSFGLYTATEKGLDHPIYILPYDSKCLFEVIDTSSRDDNTKATMTLIDKKRKSVNNEYHGQTNGTSIFIEYGDTILNSFLIQGNFPEYKSDRIIPKYEGELVYCDDLEEKIKIAKVNKEDAITISEMTKVSIKHAKLLSDKSWVQEKIERPIISIVDNVTRVIRPIM